MAWTVSTGKPFLIIASIISSFASVIPGLKAEGTECEAWETFCSTGRAAEERAKNKTGRIRNLRQFMVGEGILKVEIR
eukprot:CAMPEP_0184720038 /NCGR_PEP_ID=MMETSP0314-20130426/9807_1 /TAXON_ID=38298 /ORGANISM="Rhodella maculata, Strain CCMP 736" /LENGTH=77 /DNA_ID=CAMNT_0027184023 /DNA_START=113 /DNA_END=343 /DNA_ORIENTATION=+